VSRARCVSEALMVAEKWASEAGTPSSPAKACRIRSRYVFAPGKECSANGLRGFVLVAAIYSLANFSILLLIAYVAKLDVPVIGGPTLAVIDYVMFNIVYALLAVQAGTLSDRVGRKPVLLVGYGAFVAGCVGFALVREPFVLVSFFFLFGISYAFVEGTQRALVADLSPADLKATSLGTYHAAVGLGKLPSSILAGLLAVTFSPAVMFLAHGSIAIVAATLFIGAFGERQPAPPRAGGSPG